MIRIQGQLTYEYDILARPANLDGVRTSICLADTDGGMAASFAQSSAFPVSSRLS